MVAGDDRLARARWARVGLAVLVLTLGAGAAPAVEAAGKSGGVAKQAEDADGDGLSDELEEGAANPTDASDPDSDDDDLCDGPNEVEGICVAGEDLDADGVVDADETDPNRLDSDAGGTADGQEVLVDGTDPLDPEDDVPLDRDGDGLPDTVEADFGTDPTRADTDGDGLSDGLEVGAENATLPTDPDSDNDGLCDGPNGVAATCAGGEDLDADGRRDARETDPNDADTDDGGVEDGREVLVDGTNPLDPADDGRVDTDGDGLDDQTEEELGTDPDDPDSDDGGVDDGSEVSRGTDPLDASDDLPPEPDPEREPIDTSGFGVRGGSLLTCRAAPETRGAPWGALLVLLGVLARGRRLAR